MSDLKIKLDLSQARALIPDVREAVGAGVRSATRRSVEVMRSEVPGGANGRMGRGISSEHDTEEYPFEGRVIASAVVKKGARTATMHLPGGGTKDVSLRASEFDIAEVVATGSGLHGPRGQLITPKNGRMLLIGVDSIPSEGSYLDDGSQKYIVRPSSQGQRPNPYPDRTADRIEGEVDRIFDQALAGQGVIN